MKKLLVASIVIASSLSVGGVSTTVHAADAGTVAFSYDNVAHQYVVTPSTITAEVGDTITVTNTEALNLDVGSDDAAGEGRLSVGSSDCWPFQAQATCMVAPTDSTTYTVVEQGVITVEDSMSRVLQFEIVAPSSHRARPKRTVTLDPAGGVCSGHSEPWTEEFRGSLDLPTKDDCSKVGYEFLGWVWVRGLEACHSDIQEDCPSTSKVFLSGGLMAIWRELSPPEPPVGASVLVNFLCTICSQVAIWWEPSPSSGVTYEIVVSTGDPKTTSSTTNVTQPALASAPFIFELGPNIRYTIELFAVRAGVRSSAALFNPVASGSTSSSEDLVSSIPSTRTPYASFMLRDTPENRTITIDCGRTTVSGKPGVYCNGQTTGFATGDVMIPMVKFPGQTEYTAGAARPAVGTAGGFSWQRKTGKKVYVYFVSQDGKTTSSRYIIPAK